MLVCIDGFGPDYLEAGEVPNLRSMAHAGFLKSGRCMMPSVTNVNNVSIVTASYPEAHGICSNYVLDRPKGKETYMESGEYVLRETLFQRASRQGAVSVLCTAKDKLRTLIGNGATVALSAEAPPDWVVNGVGQPPEIYSVEVNGWLVRAAGFVAGRHHADLVYIATTDYAMHTYAPEEAESQRHMSILDGAIGELVESQPNATVLLTADHGMSAKRRMVDVGSALSMRGIRANPVPIIKDRYTAHHSNLGGSIYVHLDQSDVGEALEILREIPGVEEAIPRGEAAASLRLHPERIGDIVVLGEEDVVFGDPAETAMPPRLRSHGSRHETAVPILGYNGDFDGFSFEENRDVGRYVFERVLA